MDVGEENEEAASKVVPKCEESAFRARFDETLQTFYKLANFAIKSDSILSWQLQLITIHTIEVDQDRSIM